MAGYYGYSMSNNAVEAYDNGYKPLSKWTKQAIIEELVDNTDFVESDFKGISLSILKTTLRYKGWHHTSSKYNETAFYSVNYGLTHDDLERLRNETLQEKKDEKAMEMEKPEKVFFSYVEWKGTRKHPKPIDREAYGIKKENRIYYLDEFENVRYKQAYGNYIEIKETYKRAPRGTASIFTKILKKM